MESGGLALSGTRVIEVKIKSDGDVFLELWKSQQHQLPSLAPTTIQNCQIQGGEVGTVGCVFLWNYVFDGKDCAAISKISGIDEDKKSVTYEALGGDLLLSYKTLFTNIRVETDGTDNLVTWTVEYEKLGPNAPDPDAIMDFCINTTKDIETHSLQT